MSLDESEISFPQANIAAIKGIAGVLAPSLGPVSHDKFIGERTASQGVSSPGGVAYDEYVVTGDGRTILDALPLEHPIAPVVRRVAGDEFPEDTETVGEHVTDGVTSTVLLLASLLDEAETLLEQGVHPTTVRQGYVDALSIATDSLRDSRQRLDSFSDPAAAELAVARTAMTGNDVGGMADRWAEFACEAAAEVGYPTPETFGVEGVSTGSIEDSRLLRGTVLPRNEIASERMPTAVDDATVLVLSGFERGDAGDGRVGGLRNPELTQEATIEVSEPGDIVGYEDLYAERRGGIIRALIEHDVDVVVTRLGIDDRYQRQLADAGILAVRGVNRLKLARIAKATGANQVRDPSDISADDLGYAGRVEQQRAEKRSRRRGRRRIVVFDGCRNPDSMTVFLRGNWGELNSEAARQLRKATAAVASARGEHGRSAGVVPGGGAADIGVARDVRAAAPGTGSRPQLAMDAFADAVERIPYGLAKNAGLDPISTLADLREAASNTGYETGLVLPEGVVTDVEERGVLDPFALKTWIYVTAVEVAGAVLRIDDAIDAKTSREPADEGDVIFDDHAEKHRDHLDEHGTDGTVWE
ncbi:TCP-1/cpn60 chaperonin family protein [Natrinema sp. LN54]|uniref:TCP-1/cpn60 chaperonin family protein n=1 Tax=Natrinema sp. LN54 TaxID=3458705 RepID=UPI0040372D69